MNRPGTLGRSVTSRGGKGRPVRLAWRSAAWASSAHDREGDADQPESRGDTKGEALEATTLFGAIYLLSHGIAKIVLVALVLRDKLWAYPWLIVLLLAFIGYQLYRITAVHFSAGLTALTIFDAFLVWPTWREYRSKKARGDWDLARGLLPNAKLAGSV